MSPLWLVLLIALIWGLAYKRASLPVWTVAVIAYLFFYMQFVPLITHVFVITASIFVLVILGLNIPVLRRNLISRYILKLYRRVMPKMSATEQQALAAGQVSWEGELFAGMPNWKKLADIPAPQLSREEQAFLDGPVEEVCAMVDDWDVTHKHADLSPQVWQYLKNQGFFALIIPKKFGGKAFSAYAHSQILIKLASRSVTLSSTVAVPNSLGPAELLLHYGTQAQKDHYLPRLANGEDVPCFALTGPQAGSDASAIPDIGVVCHGEHDGERVLGIKLNFNKRYITLAPVATVIGLAFKMQDPDGLLGNKKDIGITCALLPRSTPGITIGRRHMPLNIVFQNGPIQGKDVFIPLDYIIGGKDMAGQGWRMLVECLSAGRAISLPATATAGGKVAAFSAGAYARVREQFNSPIGRFEGIMEALARIGGHAYMTNAARRLTLSIVDQGVQPSVLSAILKYHSTQWARLMANDAMDIHAGKGICLGPNNYLGRGYQSVPIAITVEGANILTRSLIIFGQGSIRCHPHILPALQAAHGSDVKAFDNAIFGHIGFSISNFARSLWLSLTAGRLVPFAKSPTQRYYQQLTRYSANFALLADMCMLVLGASLKWRERMSARLGDVLSHLYIASAVLKHFEDQGSPADDQALVDWSCQYLNHAIEQAMAGILRNLPQRFAATVLRCCIFPYGARARAANDRTEKRIAGLLTQMSAARQRLTQGIYTTYQDNNALAKLDELFKKITAYEGLTRTVKAAVRHGEISGDTWLEKVANAVKENILNQQEADILRDIERMRDGVIAVDDFDSAELTSSG